MVEKIKEEDFWSPTEIVEDAKKLRHDIFTWENVNGIVKKVEVYWQILEAKDKHDIDIKKYANLDLTTMDSETRVELTRDISSQEAWSMVEKGQKHEDVPKSYKKWSRQDWDICPKTLKEQISGKITGLTRETTELFFSGQTQK